MVESPVSEPNTDDRHLELQQHLDPILGDLIDQFSKAGYTTSEVIEGMRDVLWTRRMASEKNLSHDDDSVPEPSNEWPAAD
ncbi:hypothetical protein [Pararhizobium sp. PWRC1-1]|uniref:hypothetical protein n=1 Tax=Pararhizobium sp. PWRC1-1 TaxID=2804566 RepID=UPI003CFA7EC4